MKWDIAKEFGFDYGHRVHVQKLDSEFSLDDRCVCRHLHGHRGKVIVYLSSDKLNDQEMVTDFKHLGWFKKFLDDSLDHKMVLDLNDPIIAHLFPLLRAWKSGAESFQSVFNSFPIEEKEYYMVKPELYEGLENAVKEVYEGLILVNFVPTSENLSKWLYEIVRSKMSKIDVTCSRVQFFETPKSQSNYSI